jgi:hypothetical protein
MNQVEYIEFLTKVVNPAVSKMRQEGQKEYAQDDENIFANFERVGSRLNIDRKKALMVYLLKHIDGISSFVNGHVSQREAIGGRITDSIVYLNLLWAMINENGE